MNTTEQVPTILCKFVRDNKDFPKTDTISQKLTVAVKTTM